MFSTAGRSFHSGNGGNGGRRQKKYICNGAKGGCRAIVRACKQNSGEFKVTFVVAEHNDCSGGKVGAKAAALKGLASAAMVSNPTIKGTDLKRSLEQSTGLKVSYSAATRASKDQILHGYRIMDSYCKELVKDCPGSVAAVEAGRLPAGSVVLSLCSGVLLTLWCENAALYKTLLRNCKKNPKQRDLPEDSKTTYFTDQHKGAACALRGEAPLAQHRYCLRPPVNNLEEKIGSVGKSMMGFFRDVVGE